MAIEDNNEDGDNITYRSRLISSGEVDHAVEVLAALPEGHLIEALRKLSELYSDSTKRNREFHGLAFCILRPGKMSDTENYPHWQDLVFLSYVDKSRNSIVRVRGIEQSDIADINDSVCQFGWCAENHPEIELAGTHKNSLCPICGAESYLT